MRERIKELRVRDFGLFCRRFGLVWVESPGMLCVRGTVGRPRHQATNFGFAGPVKVFEMKWYDVRHGYQIYLLPLSDNWRKVVMATALSGQEQA